MPINAGLSMNELSNPPASEPLDPPHTKSVVMLRQARERAGLEIDALAAMLKVPVRRLESLEAGRFDELPDMTFARTLALSMCRVLKVDPQPILADFPASAQVRLADIDRSLNTPMPSRSPMLGFDAKLALGAGLSWPKVLAVLMIVVAVLLWFFLPGRDDAASVTEAVSPPPTTVVLPAVPAVEPDPPLPEPPLPDPPLPDPVPHPAPSTEPPAPPAVAPALPVDATNGLAMTARETAWVQVTGASGRVLLQRSLQPGETVVLSTDFPLSVVVGRADEVTVSLRGASFDLAPLTRNNVARFEVR